MEIRSDSTEYAHATITADHDLASAAISVALPTSGTEPSTYHDAEVTGSVDNGNGTFTTSYRLLIGPSGVTTLTDGTYDWIVKVNDTPEVPVRKAGTITVT